MSLEFQKRQIPPVHQLTGQWEDRPQFPGLPQDEPPPAARPLRVCIATFDVAGPIRCGGMGTSLAALARALADAGHEVTLLYLSRRVEWRTMDYWISYYAQRGISLMPLPKCDVNLRSESKHRILTSYEAYLCLKDQSFDVIHFHEWQGVGYWSVVAKHLGLAFRDTTLVVQAKGPTLWSRMSNIGYIDEVSLLEVDFMERRSVALADVGITPSQYAARWLCAHRWDLPGRFYVQGNILSHEARCGLPGRSEPVPERRQVNEFVFFGRLETRKGVELFCDALDLLARTKTLEFKVAFLGKEGTAGGRPTKDYLEDRGRNWHFPWRIISDCDHAEAVKYLTQGGQLAVIPSLDETYGNTVLEAIGLGIPFLASAATAFPEVVAEQDHERVLFPPRADALGKRLEEALQHGAWTARPAVDPKANEDAWVRWHESLPRCESSCGAAALPPLEPESAPLVSVCMPTYNRPRLLRQALESVEALDYPNFEVVLVDDASTDAEAKALLEELSAKFAERGWQLIRHERNRFATGARNTAARRARGEYLLFMDDDNLAKPHELDVLVRVAQRTGAAVVTSFRDNFTGLHPPDSKRKPSSRTLYLAGPVSVALFRNVFGDNNALVKREVYLALGGQTVLRGVTSEDREFYITALLSGERLEVIPESLFYYRMMETGLDRASPRVLNRLRVARPYMAAVPESLHELVLLAQGMTQPSGDRRLDYHALPGLHLLRIGLRNCIREGPRKLLSDVMRKMREVLLHREKRNARWKKLIAPLARHLKRRGVLWTGLYAVRSLARTVPNRRMGRLTGRLDRLLAELEARRCETSYRRRGDGPRPRTLTYIEWKAASERKAYYEGRWDYLKEAIGIIQRERPRHVLELGPGGLPLVKGSDTMDRGWFFPTLTYRHDATVCPWPVGDKQYDLFVALQVWEHLDGRQREAFSEVMRVARAAVLSFPYKWSRSGDFHDGIDESVIAEWTLHTEPVEVRRVARRIMYFFRFSGAAGGLPAAGASAPGGR